MTTTNLLFYHRFSAPLLFRCHGKFAARYLHNRLTNDINALKPLQSCLAFALTPQGKIEGLLLVQCTAPDDMLVIADSGAAEETYQILNRYHVSEPFKLEQRTGGALLHLFGEEGELARILKGSAVQGELSVIPRRRTDAPGVDIAGDEAAIAELEQSLLLQCATAIDEASLHTFAIRAGVPWFPEVFHPGELLSATLLPESVSLRKGCYVGQEILEKLDARGQHPRPLIWMEVEGSTLIPKDTPILKVGEERPAGTTLESATTADGGNAAAFAHIRQPIPSAEELRVLGRRVVRVTAQR